MSVRRTFLRLPTNVVPVNYKLLLEPNLNDFTYRGSLDVQVQIKENTKEITVNAADIKITSVEYSSAGLASKILYDVEQETVTFLFAIQLKVGSGVLSVKFTGTLNDKMNGFYKNKYTTPEGDTKYGAVTQFAPTDARRMFPCWDEPAVKATFEVTLIVPQNLVALCNTPVKSSVPYQADMNKLVVKYEKSPVMSTYLLAAAVGEYDFIEDTDSDGVLVRVYTPVGKSEQGKYALEVAVKTLPFYKRYFRTPYPLKKLDLVAVQDFAPGAMENWGLVTFRESVLLVDPENTSSANRQRVALVVGHELAHQWFGNLVTMEWWTHLWLSEGFATWIGYLCADYCYPEYDVWTQFASTDFTKAMELDALKNSHPIEVPVEHPCEIDEIFDAISYCKGGSVIRMLHHFIGDEDFRKGLYHYLNSHQYNNASTEDLWFSLKKISSKPVDIIMSNWTKQSGYPVLKVTRTNTAGKAILNIKQEMFCMSRNDLKDNQSIWMIPVSVCTSSSPSESIRTFIMDEKEVTVTLDNVTSTEWIKLNCGGVGFYRTQYSSGMLDVLVPAIQNKSLSPRDRLSLQSDMFALARAGLVSTKDFLEFARNFVEEDNYTVWSDLSHNLDTLSTILQYTDFHNSFQQFTLSLFNSIVQKVGWDAKPGEGHLDSMLRGLVIRTAGQNGNTEIMKEAQKRFAAYCNGQYNLPADLKGPVYSICLQNGDQNTYEALIKLYKNADLQEEKVRILRSLGSVQSLNVKQHVLEFSVGDDVRAQDSVFVIAGAAGSREGRELAWNFIQKRWEQLHKRYIGGFLLKMLIKVVTENFVTDEKKTEIKNFFESHPAPAAERTIQQSLENIEINRKQLSKDSAAIKKFLTSA